MGNGWKFALKDLQGDGWGWMTWRQGEPGSGSHGVRPSHSEALKAAHDAIEAASPKPADPAWMVEVAWEGCQRDADAYTIGVDYRSGAYDDTRAFRSAIFALHVALERGHVVDAGPIREMLLAGQGDDDGSQILPDLHEGMTLHAMVEACVHLLERRRDALDGYANSGGKPRPAPTEEEMLRAAREDAAQVWDRERPHWSRHLRTGEADGHDDVLIALQARRNMLREMGAVRSNWAPPVEGFKMMPPAPAADLEAALKRAWEFGWFAARDALLELATGTGDPTELHVRPRDRDAILILSTLPAKG